MFWKYLVVFLIGIIVGYIIKDNWSKADASSVNYNKVKQKGEGNILNFFQELKQQAKEKRLTRKERKEKRKIEKGRRT
jgi:hypothetical protein